MYISTSVLYSIFRWRYSTTPFINTLFTAAIKYYHAVTVTAGIKYYRCNVLYSTVLYCINE